MLELIYQSHQRFSTLAGKWGEMTRMGAGQYGAHWGEVISYWHVWLAWGRGVMALIGVAGANGPSYASGVRWRTWGWGEMVHMTAG